MDINFKSLSISPSDHECQEGDMAAMLNLVNEDGSLQPIPQPKQYATIDFTTSGLSFTVTDFKLYIHEVDTDSVDSADHQNYIAVTYGSSGNHVLWKNDITDTTEVWKCLTDLDGFKISGITFTGRIMNLVGESEQRWCMWNGSAYNTFKLDDFKYSIKLTNESAYRDGDYVLIGSDYENSMDIQNEITSTSYENILDAGSALGKIGTNTSALGVTAAGTKAILDGLDAVLAQKIANDDSLHRHMSFGFAAIRMYDGSHIMFSDLFVLGGRETWKTISIRVSTVDGLQAATTSNLHRHNISIIMPNCEKLTPLIQGVDIYVSTPAYFMKYDKAYRFGTPIKAWDESESHMTSFTLEDLSDKEFCEALDNLTFHRSLYITREEIDNSVTSPIKIKAVSATDTAVSLNDFYRAKHGATVAHNYNGRLNIGDVIETLSLDDSTDITYVFSEGYGIYGFGASWNGYFMWNSVRVLGNYDETIADYPITLTAADVIMQVNYIDSYGSSHTTYTKRSTYMPLPPLIMFPVTDISSIQLAFKDSSDNYGYTTVKLYTSETGNWSYFFHRRNNKLSFWSRKYYESSEEVTSDEFTYDGASTIYSSLLNFYNQYPHYTIYRYRNRIYVSEAGNPFVFAQENVITVGNGTVLALAAPTQPVSLGQAGQTPLVAFTSEGLYPLYIDSSDGSLGATQPGPRDVLTNIDSVTPIDDAILFVTDRGIMMFSGNSTQCISDSLRGNVPAVTLPHISDIITTLGTAYTSDNLQEYAPSEKLSSILASCKIIYDYTDQRLLLFTPNTTTVLVFSLRSQQWGVTDFNYVDVLNSYPEALAVGKDSSGNTILVDAHNDTPDNTQIPVHLITRPLSFGEPDTLKRVSSAIIRGYFQKGHMATAVYGSRDLFNWFLINTSKDQYVRGREGTPYKYFRFVTLGKLDYTESVYGLSIDASGSQTNQLR